eukprot:CAMPEP_0113530782 /NCGR_PEP_ID=MMETSP0015_2-20120614/3136_1 /TAXON_ID=2838 /ORGANISM="Odontella" /LENGTH=909 /DNA_ID=CAMNT_0000429553 /DNA_START=181 /DNA_END=2910 /DNA_ORIENTATION=+ /assembly_acc=CAM_ASM_000160
MSDNPQAGQGRPLPKKESDLFKSVVKHYETKQYKKGIKSADAILKKYPNHGETLCMKGLTLNCQGKRDEAHELVKKGLMNDMRSHVCWHVYGLLHRSDRSYNEAIKAYKQALRIDSENLQILRDLSLLQVQMRDVPGFGVTRHTILTLKPNQKINWLSFAMAKHLGDDLKGAVNVIDIYIGTLEKDSPELRRGFETSELALYRNTILAEIPDNLAEALEHLESCKDVVMDIGSWFQLKASYLLRMGRFEEARNIYVELFKRGHGDDYRLHSGYMCSVLEVDRSLCSEALELKGTATLATMVPLSCDQKGKLLDAYREELGDIIGPGAEIKSQAYRRIPLTLLEGDELIKSLDKYCRRGLSKGVPSLGSDLSALFLIEKKERYSTVTDPVDVKLHPIFAMIIELVDGYISTLESGSKFSSSAFEEEQSPSTLLWALYLRSFLHELCGEYSEGITVADKCIEHTPTAVDVYELKGRLLAAAGDISSAADALDQGRELDKQDRYINNRTTEYLLRANREDEARSRIALFTRHEGDPERNLYDMQCSWYELEVASCLARKEEWGKSLKKYMAVVKHFEDFHDDQFDFHSYCIRKVTLRAYADVLRFENELWGQPYYGKAAEGVIRNYLHLHDHPEARTKAAGEEPDYSKMTAAERKKAKAIARKKKKKAADQKRKADEEAEKKRAEAAVNNPDNGNNKKGKGKSAQQAVVDEDPDGVALLKLDPLEEAKKFSAILSTNAPTRVSTWVLQYDVAIRRGKQLMALQALFKARALEPENSEVFKRTVDFVQRPAPDVSSNATVKDVLKQESSNLLGEKSPTQFVMDAAARAKENMLTSLPMRIAVAKALISTKAGSVTEATSLIIDGGIDGRGVSVDSCCEALKCLCSFGEGATKGKEKWLELAKKRFPFAPSLDV